MCRPVSQGRKANERGEALREEIAHLLHEIGRLQPITVGSLQEFRDVRGSFLHMTEARGYYAEGVPVVTGCFGKPFKAHFLIQPVHWHGPFALWFKSQESTGTAEDRILRLFVEVARLGTQLSLPGFLLFSGDHILGNPAVLEEICYWRNRTYSNVMGVFEGTDCFRTWLVDGMPPPDNKQLTFA
jgi:hypothetical protein